MVFVVALYAMIIGVFIDIGAKKRLKSLFREWVFVEFTQEALKNGWSN